MSERRAAIVVFAALLLLSIFGFFYFRDNFATHYAVKVLSDFRSFEIPYWNFADGGGQPLAGNPNTLTFYPDNVLYLFLPPHIAFNLHFLLHLVAGWFAMRALAASVIADDERGGARFAAWLWVLSGAAISAGAFYNLITAIAWIPLALLAVEKRSVPLFGLAFGLMALAGEPVTLIATALACLMLRPPPRMFLAIPIAIVIALPQWIAYREIAAEVERGAHRYSAQTVLNASLDPRRIIELFAGPFVSIREPHLFPCLLIGLIAIPALIQRSRYTVISFVTFFFALGRFNPLVRILIERVDVLRLGRYPEKFALPMTAAIVVLVAIYFARKGSRLWVAITFVPLLFWLIRLAPVDWWAPYALEKSSQRQRVYVPVMPGGQEPDRAQYRQRARNLEPLFGATAGCEYVLNRSGDGMHSLLSRVAVERFESTHNQRYLRIATMPAAFIVDRAIGVASVNEAVRLIETQTFDERTNAIATRRYDGFTSSGGSVEYERRGQTIHIAISASAPALLFINQSFFTAWDARDQQGRALATTPLDLDRLGVLIPQGTTEVTLRFGRHHVAVALSWLLSSIVLVVTPLVEVRDRRRGQEQRSSDENRPV